MREPAYYEDSRISVQSSESTASAAAPDFFAGLPVLSRTGDTFDTKRYRPAPDDWLLVVTDVVDSTSAIARGEHKTVNFVASMAIAALKNLCAPTLIPFLFGGDGSVVMVPPQRAADARIALARVRGFALREFGMALRVGVSPVGELRRHGADVRVGRFEPTAGNSFGVFAGGGVGLLEEAARGRGDPALIESAAVAQALDDGQPVDLNGLSCRWNPLQSTHGKMVALIIHGAADPRAIHDEIMRVAGQGGDPRPVRKDTLHSGWPPKGFMLEARAARRGRSLPFSVLRVLGWGLIAHLIFRFNRTVGSFVPQRYVHEITTNTDFCKHDDTLCFVIDTTLEAVDRIRALLEQRAARGELRYGMDVSDTALMTCLVTSTGDGLHVHFVDGGDGGYTNAATAMKQRFNTLLKAAGV